jgi:predicted ABC-type ATPase
MPDCYVIAGSNGAGKTTFAREFLPNYANCLNFVNPDLIAAGLSPFAPSHAMHRAGRLVLSEINSKLRGRETFGFETTLSGRAYISLLRRLRSLGYNIHMFYLWLPSPEIGLERIRERVEGGGHDVPERDVRRRYHRTLKNLFQAYRKNLDTLHFFDNSTTEPKLVFHEERGNLTILHPELYESILARAGVAQ